ncbi:MAG: hypothetical protein ACLGIC_10170 [Acidimicrobiia bacterium]
MHLVLGSERVDLRRGVVVIATPETSAADRRHADLAWVRHGADAPEAPFGGDAADAAGVRRLADAGAVVVGLADPTESALDAAGERGLAVLVPAVRRAAGRIPPERLLVTSDSPVDGAVAVLDLDATGPAAWGRATVALAAGVRVVRTSEPRSIRRVATVVERLTTAVVRA